jgi:hypothetical protein
MCLKLSLALSRMMKSAISGRLVMACMHDGVFARCQAIARGAVVCGCSLGVRRLRGMRSFAGL